MLRGKPSLLALLGLAAMAGLQNRGRMNEAPTSAEPDQEGLGGAWGGSRFEGGGFGGGFGGVFPGDVGGGFVFDLSDLLSGRPPGVAAAGGLGDLLDHFQAAGHGPAAQSWVSDEPNQPVAPGAVEQAISDDLLLELEQRTGLPRAEILERLATGLPETVNQLTPQGRVPTEAEAEQLAFDLGPADQPPAEMPTRAGAEQTPSGPDRVEAPQDNTPKTAAEEQFLISPDAVELKEPGSGA